MRIWFSRLVRSWTIWFNSYVAVLISFITFAAANIDSMRPYLGHTAFEWIGGLTAAANLLLRFHSTNALQDK